MAGPDRKKTLWVHRLASTEGGTPTASVKLGDARRLLEVRDEIVRTAPLQLEREEGAAQAFLVAELRANRLRQGWSYPGLDLGKADYRDRYVIAMRRYWDAFSDDDIALLRKAENEDVRRILLPFYKQAQGRFAILDRMRQMNRGDIVFIPNAPTHGSTFSIAEIAGNYVFDDRGSSESKKFWELDFGHRRDVTNVRTFDHSAESLPANIFGAPYMHAIDKVQHREDEFRKFLARVQ